MKKFLMDESGQGMVEYGLILGLIAVAGIVALIAIGPKITALFTKTQDSMSTLPSE